MDHVGLSVAEPDAAARDWAVLLGAAPVQGRRFELANMALEIGPGGEAPEFSLGLAADDLAGTRRLLERRGLTFDDQGLEPSVTRGVRMVLRPRRTAPSPPARPDAPHALDHVVIQTSDPERAIALYGGRLGLDLRLDRANPQWGTRLLFFRCGNAVLEVSAALGAPAGDGPDRITGLAWRVSDADAARARLAAAGLDVSPVRAGRKPGTRVFTVRAGVPGAPALILAGSET